MTGSVPPRGTHRIVRHVTRDKAKLEKIADILRIPKAERGKLHMVELHTITSAAPAPRKRRAK
jgi:hypothetical protein